MKMSDISWTNEQKLAIECCIGNTIVSAGAGSGKTAVLTERIFNHLCNGIDIDHLLVLTFTKAAASSMKEKTKKKIIENKNNALDKENQKKQLDKIDGSYIMTFDAYALSLVKKYHYLLNVSNNINVVDDNVLKIKREEILEEILNQKYLKKDTDFLETVSDLCIKNDDTFKKGILDIDDKMDLIIDKKEFIENYNAEFFSEKFIERQLKKYQETTLEILKNIEYWLTKLENVVYGYENKFMIEDVPKLKELIECKTIKQLEEQVFGLKLSNLTLKNADKYTKKTASDLKKQISEGIKEMVRILSLTKSEATLQIEGTRKYVEVILDIIKKLNEKTLQFKKEKDLYSYNDIAKMSIEIVKDNPNIKEEIKNYFAEILVDEYQDNSDIQEIFINLISDNNVFVVGDIKQSIYGFRNANPLNFQKKYENCKKSSFGTTIDLNKNFRSRKEVLDTVNKIFVHLMDEYIGGVNYDASQAMVFGMKKYNEFNPKKDYYQTEIINYPLKEEISTIDDNGNLIVQKVDSYPFLNKEYNKAEVEALIIASDIKKKIKNGFKVLDNKKSDDVKLRDVKYGDFCIMAQSKTQFDLFNKILSAEEIPVKVEREVQIADKDIVKVIKRIFLLIDNVVNKNDYEITKHCYASIERSFLFQKTDETIYQTIKDNAILKSESYLKCFDISKNIEDKTILEVFNEIVESFNFYEKIHLIGEVEMNIAILEYLSDLALQLGQIGYTYSSFATHLEEILSDSNKKLEFKLNQKEENAVKIMSIHNSKGLEFHVCYFPLLFNHFIFKETSGSYLFDSEKGLILPYKYYQGKEYYGLADTFIKDLFALDKKREIISERIRLFYVALTRAQEKIVLVCSLDLTDEELTGIVDNETRSKYKSFLGFLNSLGNKLPGKIKNIDLKKDVKLSKKYLDNNNDAFKNLNKSKGKIVVKQFDPIVPSTIEKGKFSKDVSLVSKETKDIMQQGTKLHYFMELIDFKNPDYSLVEEPFKIKVKNFLESDLLKDVEKAQVTKEFEFIYLKDKQEKHGFIDLLLEYDDKFVIIDYKLKNIDDESYDSQLLGYKEYLQSISEKEVECYLYSLMESNYRQVK